MYTSQLGQDAWVHSVLGNKENGFFIELGASDGNYISNTYFFEKTLGWKGICIEPNPMFYETLSKTRKCNICFSCVSDKDDTEVQFYLDSYASGVTATVGPFTQSTHPVMVKTKTLQTILKTYNAPATIDYLSLDVEGHEYEVMKNFPFHDYIINCITVEHNAPHTGPEMQNTMNKLLTDNGYVFVKGNDDILDWGHGPIDDFYVHHTILKTV